MSKKPCYKSIIMSKNKKQLIRIICCSALFLPLLVLFILSELDKFTKIENYVYAIVFGVIYIISAYDVLISAFKNIFRGHMLDENFLMAIASIGAFILGEYAEGVAVMLFYQVGEIFQSYAVGKSRKSISALMDIRPDKANVIREGKIEEVYPEEVEVGEVFEVKAGEKIPLDGIVVSGNANLNTAAITGESAPFFASQGCEVISGCIALDGVIRVKAQREFYDSTVSKILDLVENASSKKAKTENFIRVFSRYYTPFVVSCAILLSIIPSIFTGEWSKWIFRALTFLVVSCPCALVISVPLGFFGGLGGAGKHGVLIKGANYIEQLSKANLFILDKTGTLTTGEFSVCSIHPESDRENILKYAAICENNSTHPIAKSIVKEYGKQIEDGYNICEIAGEGVIATRKDERIVCGNAKLLESQNISFSSDNGSQTTVYIAINGKFLGCIELSDTLRQLSKTFIDNLKSEGAKVKMLTGDNEFSAKKVASTLGIEDFKFGLLPQDKAIEVENIITAKNKGDVVAFMGDGINDAPVIMRADVGISMGGIGSDSAIEAADIVLMYDDPSSIVTAKKIAKKTMAIVKQNIVFSLVIKFGVLILSAFGLANMWLAVFADVGVAIIAILNAMRAMKTDNLKISAHN